MILNKEEIKKIIPYDEPFLFVDEAEIVSENEIKGDYQTKPDDYYFKGHFVDFPIMPGVLILEALGQLATILLRKKIGSPSQILRDKTWEGKDHKNYHFLAYDIRNVQFYKPIFPGEKIIFKAEVLGIYPVNEKTKISRVKGQALVENDLRSEGRFSIAIIDKKEFEKKYKK